MQGQGQGQGRPRRARLCARDAAALAVGADAVAGALQRAARGLQVQIVRNGSRGLLWLETLVEVETPEGRMAYGPVTADAVPGLIDAGMLQGGSHALCHGLTEAIAYLARQERLTFARVGVIDPLNLADYAAHGGWQGWSARRAWSPQPSCRRCWIRACAAVAVRRSRPASSGRPWPPQRAAKVHCLQRRRG